MGNETKTHEIEPLKAILADPPLDELPAPPLDELPAPPPPTTPSPAPYVDDSVTFEAIRHELAGIRELMAKSYVLDLVRVNPGSPTEEIKIILNRSVREGKEAEFLYE